ncbi:peptide/nickel transport system ATP-binding protein [Streptomyces sp. PanSC19]|uniref:dipeptide ABC transporter ATP-binding protein n=1 Tax=Streptomyces sp. PanSC19 TaxID=1520455 RepID=UPI000F47B930|nr:ABC transporter ATP-binding protein [Streptomyces sp. PanSC19]ROQ27093.1 peptide/nickel transport system ATP-binding protein [Streptomyces sp. PanSC19]
MTFTLAPAPESPSRGTGPVPALSVRDLRISFPSEAGPVEAVRGVGFDLLPGRTLGIVGESGSGKSATAMGIMGLLPPTARVSGEVLLGGRDLVGLNDGQLSRIRGKDIGMVFQDPLSALPPIHSVGRLLSDALRVHQDLTKQAAWNRAVELLDLVGIPEPRRRARSFPHEFSGGMRQRVVIALAMANAPSVIVADEPTTALDVTVQAQILDVLRTAQTETGAAVVLITHDLGVVAGYADDVAVMYAGRIVERAGAEELFRRPAMPYTIGLLGAVPRPDGPKGRPLAPIGGEPPSLVALPPGCPFADRCPAVLDACRTREPAVTPVAGHGDVACLRADEIADGRLAADALFPAPDGPEVPEDTAPGEVVLRVSGLSKTFPVTKGAFLRRRVGTLHAVSDVGFDLRAGETLGLVGESGSGKTTTLLEILRLRPPESGRIEVTGTDVADLGSARRLRELRGAVQIVMQDPTGSLDPRLPVFRLLAEPLQAVGADRSAIRGRVAELLGMVGLDASVADRFPQALSGGQRQRVGIARALATRPRILVLDEPVSALDVSVQAGVVNLLARLQRELGLAYLVVAHDLAVMRHFTDRVAVMYLGHIVETGDTEAIFENPRHPYTEALLSAIPVPDPRHERSRERIVLEGELPSPTNLPQGCVFVDRCPLYRSLDDDGLRERCRTRRPALGPAAPGSGHRHACHAR